MNTDEALSGGIGPIEIGHSGKAQGGKARFVEALHFVQWPFARCMATLRRPRNFS
jgi:hypothetical protein